MTKKEQLMAYLRRTPGVEKPADFPVMDDLEGWPADVRPLTSSGKLSMGGLFQMLDSPACERPMSGEGYDVFGVHWSAASQASHYTPGQKPIYDDITCWREQVRIPNVEKLDWDTFRGFVSRLDPEKPVSMMLLSGIFERATALTTMQECLMDAISEPEDFSDMLGAIADYKIALIDKISEFVHVDVLTYHDDWGTNRSTFMSPALWREVVRPHTQRIYDAAHRHGIFVIQHSCGCVSPLLPDMIEMGADAWDGQLRCSDMAALQREYGDRIFLLTNDAQYDFGDRPPADLPAMPPSPYPAYAEKPEFLYER